MIRLFLPIAALLLSDALLIIGHGALLTLLPLRAEREGFATAAIAATASAYFAGFVAGCLLAPWLLRRVGHIRAFAALAALFASATLALHALPSLPAWLALRFWLGLCIAGLYTVIESWLNGVTGREARGLVLSAYMVINLLMIVAGQQLLALASPHSETLFLLAAIFVCLSIVPVSLTRALSPAPPERQPLAWGRIWELSHAALVGAAAAGLVTGAFWALGPVFAREAGLDAAGVGLFVSGAVLGGALFQLPLGRLSDWLDRRVVLLGVAVAGALSSLALLVVAAEPALLPLFALPWGGTTMTVYAICLAHATDHADPRELTMVGSGILLAFGVASALGGPLAAVGVAVLGSGGLFAFCAAVQLGLAVYLALRRRRHPLPLVDTTEGFHAMAESSPAALALDPRAEEPPPPRPAPWESAHSHGGEGGGDVQT
ncbi:MAG: MFS transporter [Porticoccaceae bacterium]|nr:MAG: MFS transporter [Porticoccaceae bacterium]